LSDLSIDRRFDSRRVARYSGAITEEEISNLSNDAHSRPSGQTEELLYDENVPTPTHGERARTLVAGIGTGTLCTIAKEPAGFPYGSFVTFAMDGPDPVFFISELAEHTKNLRKDSRASLLVAETGGSDPLANGRVTLLGQATLVDDGDARAAAKEAYLAAHPNAAYYIDYSDFGFWRIDVESVRYIGGYGRMSWVETSDWQQGVPDPIAALAHGIISHMNADHADAMVSYCRAFSKATDTTEATMTGVDRYGFEMSALTAAGPRPIRLAFPKPIATSDDARAQMVAMVKRAREILAV
jgi:putative heme iron utilization protein